MPRTCLLVTLLLFLIALSSCGSTFDGARETFGAEKRDILAGRVEDARDSEEEAKVQFVSALDRYFEIVAFEQGDLEDIYDDFESEVEDADDLAKEVRGRVDDVSRAAADLFEEWEREFRHYRDQDLRRRSEVSLTETRRHYQRMLLAMRKTETKMERVLRGFRDQVLFLRRNLNARTVATLGSVASQLDAEVADLVLDMQEAIDEANALLFRMER